MTRVLVMTAWAYNPFEFWTILKNIQNENWEFKVISTNSVIEEEKTANERFAVDTLENFDIETIKEYDGLVLSGGNFICVSKYYYDPYARNIVLEFNKLNKPLAAVCATVPIMRYVLKGKKATAFPTTKVLSLLKNAGVIVTNNTLEVDGNCITAQHEEAADQMMKEFISKIKSYQ